MYYLTEREEYAINVILNFLWILIFDQASQIVDFNPNCDCI